MTALNAAKVLIAQLFRPGARPHTAITIEAFGWLLALEGWLIFSMPSGAAGILRLPIPLAAHDTAMVYLRLVGLLVAGLGALYVVCGRLNAQGFVVASMLDRPGVPFLMFVLWRMHLCPAVLALGFSLQDGGGFLWTFTAWLSEQKSKESAAAPR